MLDRVVGLVSLVPFAIGTAVGPATQPGEVDFTFRDPAIIESSGLVVTDGLFVTTNDSGESGRVFVVDSSGRTVGTTTWDDAPEDVEALAPAGPGRVWVGDIGDNPGSRDSIAVLRVPVGRGDRHVDPERYELVYPDGAHDAETLLAHPRTGQLFVVSKSVFGGTLYAAPRDLDPDRPNRLRAVADTKGFATDGSFFPDGRHYVLRDYVGATVYDFPGHEQVGSFRLPAQRQGEGIAVAADGSVHVSTEGQFTDVETVEVPAQVTGAMTPPSASASASPSPPAPPSAPSPTQAPGDRPVWPWLLGGGIGVGVVVVLLRALRPR